MNVIDHMASVFRTLPVRDDGRTLRSMHVAFTANDRTSVDAFYRAALAAGGTDNGAPGIRAQYQPHYYGAFVRDPDGPNIEAVSNKPA
jgi:predicted lactoylglutathione lyase